MIEQRSDLIKRVFIEAMELPLAEREGYLASACNGDGRAIERLSALLRAAGELDETFLETPVVRSRTAESGEGEVGDAEVVGRRVGPYRIMDRLGEGGLSVVYLGVQDEPIHRTVALKQLKPGVDTRHVLERFRFEQDILAKLEHPNIAKVIDAGVDESDRPYFAMELVRGQTIDEYCDTRRLTLRERVALLIEVAQGVRHAHMRGVIHRDLKPSNILVAEYEGVAVPKIIDFGIAKAVNAPPPEHHTRVGFPIGTPAFMSPEQWNSELDIDVRSDVYSMGVLLYFLLAGGTPFSNAPGADRSAEGREPQRASRVLGKRSASQESPYSARETRRASEALSADLDWVLRKAVSPNKNHRYASIEALASDLRRFLNHESVGARRPSQIYRLRKFCRRRQALAAMLACAGLLLGGLVVALIVHAVIITDYTRRLEDAQRTADARTRIADDAIRFLSDEVLGQASPGRLGPDARLADLVETVSPTIQDRLGNAPEVAARVHFEFGRIFDLLGDNERASLEFDLASSVLKDSGEQDPVLAADIAARHALMLARDSRRHADASSLVFAHLDSKLPPESLDILDPNGASQFRLWDALARVHDLGERPKVGLKLRRRVMSAVEQGGGFPRGAIWLDERSNFVSSLVRAGEYDEAVRVAERLLRDADRASDARTAQRAKLALAHVYRVAGRISEACTMSDRAAAEAEIIYGELHPITFDSYMLSVIAHDVSGRHNEATANARLAFQRAKRSDPNGRRWAESGSVLARVLLDSGDDGTQAGEVAAQLILGWSPGLPASEAFDSFSVSNLAEVLRRLGRGAEAEALTDALLSRQDLTPSERVLLLQSRFDGLLASDRFSDGGALLEEIQSAAESAGGRERLVLRNAVSRARGALLAAQGDFESAEKLLLTEHERTDLIASKNAIAMTLSEVYGAWGRGKEADSWRRIAGLPLNPVVLDELLRRFVEHTAD